MKKLSISLSVKNIAVSVKFYETLGFKVIDGGHVSEEFKDSDTMEWRMLELDGINIGLFRGMFEKNALAFYGFDREAVTQKLSDAGFESEESGMMQDPDGNPVLFE